LKAPPTQPKQHQHSFHTPESAASTAKAAVLQPFHLQIQQKHPLSTLALSYETPDNSLHTITTAQLKQTQLQTPAPPAVTTP
jgi:hypothetical protein